MNREIKFRAWDTVEVKGFNRTCKTWAFEKIQQSGVFVMQFTGHIENEKEIYEGDIFREEIDGNHGDVDEIYYSVVTWIKEWCMFACLIIKDGQNEYQNYLDNGAEMLDESMFWCFPLQIEKYGKRYLAGNIFQNPELLESVKK
jgi:YopX protein